MSCGAAGQPGQQSQVGLHLQHVVVLVAVQALQRRLDGVARLVDPAGGERGERALAVGLQPLARVVQQAQRLLQVGAPVGERALAHLGLAQRGQHAAPLRGGRWLGEGPAEMYDRRLRGARAQRHPGRARQQLDHVRVARGRRQQGVPGQRVPADARGLEHVVGAPVVDGGPAALELGGHRGPHQRMDHAQGPVAFHDARLGQRGSRLPAAAAARPAIAAA